MIRQGLKDFSVSRARVKWGIPVPEEPAHVFYVWMDALANYVTALGFADDAPEYRTFWLEADERMHFVGKEIIRFHCLYWPAMLRAAGVPAPTRVFAHGWLTKGGKKLSKTTGNTIDPDALIDRYGTDAFRYFFLREGSFGQDWDFTDDAFVKRYNSDLANDFGNLVSRALTMVARYCDGQVPPRPASLDEGDDGLEARFQSEKVDWDATGTALVSSVFARYESVDYAGALGLLWSWVGQLNQRIVVQAPWEMAKDPGRRPELGQFLYRLLEAIRLIAVMAWPVMPTAMERVLAMMGLAPGAPVPEDLTWGRLEPGTHAAAGGRPVPAHRGGRRRAAGTQGEESAERRPRRPRRRPAPRHDHDRRVREARPARRPGEGRGEDPGVEEAAEAAGGSRGRGPPDRLRHRRRLHAGVARRAQGGAGREPEAGEAHGSRVLRDGPGRVPRRQGGAVHLRRRRPAGHEGEVIRTLALLLAVLGAACTRTPPEVAYDLAGRFAIADRWSSRQVLLFGTPSAEPHQAEGFYREAASGGGDTFLWARREAEVSLAFAGGRAAVGDRRLAPYERVRGQSAEVFLNGRGVGRFTLNDARHRYAVALPAEAQRVGENRLRFVFAATASPSEQPGNADRRQLAAAFHSLVVGAAGDAGLDDLLRRDAPPAFGATAKDGIPALAPGRPQRGALRDPPAARRGAALHPRAAPRGHGVRGLGAVQGHPARRRPGGRRSCGPRASAPARRRPREVVVRLPGREGDVALLGLHVAGERFAWGVWTAPRVLGASVPREDAPRSAEDERRGERLRQAARGLNVVFVILDAGRATISAPMATPARPRRRSIGSPSEGVVFERVYTPAVYTLGAMASVWTSQPPDRHHGDVSFSARLPKDRLTLAELLTARGIHTAGFVANTVAGGLNGFDRGFAEFHEVWRTVGSRGDVFRQVLPPWLDAHGGRRFFAYLHFREPHSPYDPEPPFDTRFGPDGPIPKSARRPPGDSWIVDVNQGRRTLTPAEADHLVRLYDGNLAYADHEVGELRRALEARGLWDKTVVIVAADHGEALLDHGWIGHNVQLFEESGRVPLIVRFPPAAGVSGRRVGALADLLDLGPTIADLFGVLGEGGSDRAFTGRSLLPVIEGAPGKPVGPHPHHLGPAHLRPRRRAAQAHLRHAHRVAAALRPRGGSGRADRSRRRRIRSSPPSTARRCRRPSRGCRAARWRRLPTRRR